MNGFIQKTLAGLALGTGLTALGGCHCYRELVDPCWPERYSAQARSSVREAFNAQAHNGHVLDQTVWNYHFETDAKGGPTDKIHPGGMEHLNYLARRRPAPDPRIYLQTSWDKNLDDARANAVKMYLAKRNPGVSFEVAVHDPAEVGITANAIAGNQKTPTHTGALPKLIDNFQGVMPVLSGTGAGGSGGSSSSSTGGSQ
ncbi:MAG: hypothetical protein L0Y72_08730 [Gemmataceae bacterium]|nr:hypothetical protein [Gemmataceae bacterium]MCI0739116.1 hypothetical protein [Gemmataceae bacterium]